MYEVQITEIITTTVILLCYTTLYKPNRVYDIVESLIIGTATGSTLVLNIETLRNNVLTPVFVRGQYIFVISIILGLCYFSIFSRSLRNLYRAVLMLQIGNSLGIAINSNAAGIYAYVYSFSQVSITNPSSIITFVCFVSGLLYMTFSSKLASTSKYVGQIGRLAIFTYFAAAGTLITVFSLGVFVGLMGAVFTGIGWVVLLAIAAGIAFDLTIAYRSRKKEIAKA